MDKNKPQKTAKKKKKTLISQNSLFLILFLVLVIVNTFNMFILFNMTNKIKSEISKQNEVVRPAELKLLKIVASSCKQCFEINDIVAEIKQNNVKILNEKTVEFNSEEGRNLIIKYNIQKIPTIVITGELDKSSELQQYWSEKGTYTDNNETVLITNIEPPYFDLNKKKVVGLVSVVSIVDSECKECSSMNDVLSAFRASNVEITSAKSVEYDSEEGKELISKYNIRRIPTLVISAEIKEYENIASVLPRLNATEVDGNYALHTNTVPYLDLNTKKVVGLATLTLLSDSSCTECYNVSLHKSIIPNFGVVVTKEFSYDVSSSDGKKIVNKYNITKIPTIILSSESKEYPNFVQVWDSVGTREPDGSFVFRRTEVMGIYKDLSSNEIVRPSEQQQV